MLEEAEKFLSQRKKLVFAIIFFLSLGVITIGLNQTGETWDEIPYYNAGRHYMRNLKDLNFVSSAWKANKEHPPVAKYVYGLASLAGYRLDGEHYTGGRIASAIMLSLAIALTFTFTAGLFGSLVGLLASLILMLSPPFIAYGRVLGMDSISALVFLLIAISFYKFSLSKARWKDYIAPVLILGVGFATRYNIILATLFLPFAIILFAAWRGNFLKWLSLVVFPIGAVLVLYLIWPFLWAAPIDNIQLSIGHWGQVAEWYLGRRDTALPDSYFLTYYIYTTPVLVLIFALLGLFSKVKFNQKIYVIVMLLVPFINSFIGIKQGGIRYLLFSWIPLSILAALGVVLILKAFKSTWIRGALISLIVFYGIFNVAAHYPYYLDYYNELAGGTRGNYQKRLLQFGWWGEGGKRSADYLNMHAPENSRVFNNMKPEHTLDGLREDLELVKLNENPDYIVANTTWMWNSSFEKPANYRVVHEEKSSGAPIVIIFAKEK